MSDPRSPGDADRSLLARAMQLHGEGHFRDAIKVYQQLYEADPRDFDAAHVYVDAGPSFAGFGAAR